MSMIFLGRLTLIVQKSEISSVDVEKIKVIWSTVNFFTKGLCVKPKQWFGKYGKGDAVIRQ